MDALAEFREPVSGLLHQSVAEGLDAYKQAGQQATYDAEALVGAIFGPLPGPVDDGSDADAGPFGEPLGTPTPVVQGSEMMPLLEALGPPTAVAWRRS